MKTSEERMIDIFKERLKYPIEIAKARIDAIKTKISSKNTKNGQVKTKPDQKQRKMNTKKQSLKEQNIRLRHNFGKMRGEKKQKVVKNANAWLVANKDFNFKDHLDLHCPDIYFLKSDAIERRRHNTVELRLIPVSIIYNLPL